MIARRLSITGRVQGVFYRQWLIGEATRLGLAGWVRNRSDGSVEAVAEGDSAVIDALVSLARTGPPAARVDAVIVTECTFGRLAGIVKQPTA